jgi:hypothetical protein
MGYNWGEAYRGSSPRRFSEAACLLVRHSDKAKRWLERNTKKRGKARALAILSAKLGPALLGTPTLPCGLAARSTDHTSIMDLSAARSCERAPTHGRPGRQSCAYT